jgi:hypothetical protein
MFTNQNKSIFKRIKVTDIFITRKYGAVLNKDLVYLIIILCLSISTTKLNGSEFSGYPLVLDIITTSDWTKVNLENTKFYYLDDSLMLYSQNSVINLGILSIEKKSYDSSLVCAMYKFCLSQELPKVIKFVIEKGAIGETKVVLHTNAETLAVFTTTEMNRTFTVNRNTIKNIAILTFQLKPKTQKIQPMVLSFYFPWYDKNWTENDRQLVAHKPLMGYYNSSEAQILFKHIVMAKNAGIDGFIVSWWGKNSFIDSNLIKMLPICESLGFKFSLYLETTRSLEDLRNNLNYIETTYARSSSFIKIGTQPVLFIFSRLLEQVPSDSLPSMSPKFALINYGYSYSNLRNFSGFHEYLPPGTNIVNIKQNYLFASQIAQQQNKLIAATVMPGYDARRIGNSRNYIDRKNGKFYKAIWKTVLASNPDWVLITSFNEWFEDSAIESSEEYGDFYLKLTGRYSQLFKKVKKNDSKN